MCSKFNRLCFPFVAPQQNCQVTETAGLQDRRLRSIKETTVLWKPIKRFWEIVLKQINHSRCKAENTYNKQNLDFEVQTVLYSLAKTLLKDFVKILTLRSIITKTNMSERRKKL